ncbi:MAG: 3'-5' exonuclease [Clostridiales bacterium]|nr:3'-5' exonuclease [Clostridiales bacterium]
MELTLKKPIIFFDLETTGTNITHDRIVEISIIKVYPNGEEREWTQRVNPEMPIPAEATAIHHITDADVAGMPTFKQLAANLAKGFEGADIAGYNSNRFDVPMLSEEFSRAGVDFDFSRVNFIDVQTIFHKKEQRTLVAAYRFYCGKELDGAHSANADTRATYEVLKAQLDRYEDIPRDMEELSKYTSPNRNVDLMGRIIKNDKDVAVINFGKYKGQPVIDVLRRDPGYYSWIQQGDFPGDTKRVFTRFYMESKK